MKQFPFKKDSYNGAKPWKTYLKKISPTTEKPIQNKFTNLFWKNYEQLIETSRENRNVEIPLQIISSSDALTTIYQKYKPYVHQKISYKEKIIKKHWLEAVGCWPAFIALGILITAFILSFVGYKNLSQTFMTTYLILALGLIFFNKLAEELGIEIQSNVYTFNYIYEFFEDHLIFTRHRYSRKTIQKIAYHNIQAIQLVHNGVKLKELTNNSLSERIRNLSVMRQFIVFKKTDNYDHIFNFLRDIAIHNKTYQ